MAWSYDETLPTTRDQVRTLIGDIDSEDPLLDDGVIDFILTQRSTVLDSAAMAARAIAARVAGEVSKAIGRAREDLSDKYTHYMDLGNQLEAEGSGPTAGDLPIVFAGGISVGNVDYWNNAADRIAPAFTRSTLNGFSGNGSLPETE